MDEANDNISIPVPVKFLTTNKDVVPIDVVYGLYGTNWGNIITPASVKHPAKFSKKLIEYIYAIGFHHHKYWGSDAMILDPMAGVGLGGVAAMRYPLHWVGNELEDRWAREAHTNVGYAWAINTGIASNYDMIVGDARSLPFRDSPVDAIITSPPYGNRVDDRGTGPTAAALGGKEGIYGKGSNIGNLRAGGFDAIITSPPFAEPYNRHKYRAQPGTAASMLSRSYTLGTTLPDTEGNIAAVSPTKTTYWTAMGHVYAEMWRVLKPGGVAAIVVKDFVKNKQIVEVGRGTRELLESLGFTTIRRTIAMLATMHPDGKITWHKSPFRRILEDKGTIPRIDWEEVIWVRKP